MTSEQTIGEVGFVITSATALAYFLSLYLLWLYRRAVLRSMNTRSPIPLTRAPTATPSAQPHFPPPSLELVTITANTAAQTKMDGVTLRWQATRRPWHAAVVYGVAGLVFALALTLAEHIRLNEFFPIRFLLMFWISAWPVVFTVNL